MILPTASRQFRAVFDVLPEFELGAYKGLKSKCLRWSDGRRRHQAVEETRNGGGISRGRASGREWRLCATEVDGHAAGGGEPIQADSVLCHVGAEETMALFNENLSSKYRDHKDFDDYPRIIRMKN